MLANVAKRSSAEQCIAKCMQQDIRIGMTEQPETIRNMHTAENELSSRNQCMDIIPETNPRD